MGFCDVLIFLLHRDRTPARALRVRNCTYS
jgi:hypothetical protein